MPESIDFRIVVAAVGEALDAFHQGRAEFTRARLRLEPEWQGLRDDPRFRALLAAP